MDWISLIPRSACWELSMEIFWAWRGAVLRAEWGHVSRVTWWHLSRVTSWHVSRADWRQISARVITQRQAEATWENNEDKSLKLTRDDSLILEDELLVTVCCYRVVHHGCDVAVDSAVVVLAVSYKLVSGHAGAGVSRSWIYWGNDISSVRPQLLSTRRQDAGRKWWLLCNMQQDVTTCTICLERKPIKWHALFVIGQTGLNAIIRPRAENERKKWEMPRKGQRAKMFPANANCV